MRHRRDLNQFDASAQRREPRRRARVAGRRAGRVLAVRGTERIHRQLTELQQELDTESERTQLIVTLDVASQAREGDEIELWFDPRDLHLFDPVTTENVTLERKVANLIGP